MSAKAILLISVDLGRENTVLNKLKSIRNVKEVHVTYGVYDLIVEVEAGSPEQLKKTVTYEIRALADIRSTLTMVVVE